ncbi:transcription elongation factor GreA [Mycoplasmopsis fermentans]|uniref:Transcription elongation factor GreA n=2 Tax=Mycoplasmopsis fermentans TaxID=2115 RepID=C4XEX4_MYCFP|nr:transcription elongation factor GreA [Mycoplasmopsis fermentans]VEU66705.1 transcription elongation factor [Mesomycoplasma conjunctivae]ADN69002.1 transcription elongation factor [Mycoplasmopsis fermentans JER]ADV34510.1 Transcription elongation factor [Mycoplasmopsis fermentans M64]RMX35348.1 transcription elongation factor GreA domain protein [Mycoplasmopsis fermentans MF-I1]RMX35617.1 transcription elongation factor GreA domain protein [Mycoplasmopsis fermentans MF-I2]
MAGKKQEKIILAKETLEKYQAEYEHLIKVERPEIQAALKEARAQGDLSENAEYDAARDRQGIVEARIVELEGILANAEVIETNQNKKGKLKAGIGATVKYLNLKTNKEITVKIMGIHDSNPMEGNISNESPVAQAIMEGDEGATVEVDVPNKYSIKILSIQYK